MKYLKFFIAIVLFSFLLVQCQKEVPNDANLSIEKKDVAVVKSIKHFAEFALNINCGPEIDEDCESDEVEINMILYLPNEISLPNGATVIIPTDVIEAECVVTGNFQVEYCPGDVINVLDFELIIGSECEALNEFMDGLSPYEYQIVYNYISDLFQDYSAQVLAQHYATINTNVSNVNIDWWEPLCYKVCRECIHDTSDDGPIPDFGLKVDEKSTKVERKDELELRGGGGKKGPCATGHYVNRKVSCGDGCCKTTYTYSKNNSGVMVQDSKNSEAQGNCEGPSGICNGDVIIECANRCE